MSLAKWISRRRPLLTMLVVIMVIVERPLDRIRFLESVFVRDVVSHRFVVVSTEITASTPITFAPTPRD